MKSPTMLYKPGNMAESYGVKYDYIVVDAKDVAATLKKGWFSHYQDFLNEIKPKRIRRTKEQIEQDNQSK